MIQFWGAKDRIWLNPLGDARGVPLAPLSKTLNPICTMKALGLNHSLVEKMPAFGAHRHTPTDRGSVAVAKLAAHYRPLQDALGGVLHFESVCGVATGTCDFQASHAHLG